MRGSRGLRALLTRPGIVVAPGAYDALSGRLVERAGFEAVYIGSYATAASRLAMPDAGLVSLREMVDHAAAVVGAVEDIPVLADAENGFGNAATVWRTVGEFERAGVAGIHIEDHEFGKHLDVPGRLLPRADMTEKIRAAVDARRDPDFVIIARTDAGWLEGAGGLEDAIDRALSYGEAGADMVFLTAIPSPVIADIRHRVPYPICNVDTPGQTVAQEEASGVKLLLHYSLCLSAAYRAVRDALAEFRRTGDRAALRARLLVDDAELDDCLGFRRIRELALKHGVR
jgi:methylisocitrate lyase